MKNQKFKPLRSWRASSPKREIIKFVKQVTNKKSDHYVKPEDRIATFDNDGTLWAEKPTIQREFINYQVKKAIATNPNTHENKVLKDVLNGKIKSTETLKIIMTEKAESGKSLKEYRKDVRDFLKVWKSTKGTTKCKNYKEIVYKPMYELLTYLRDHDFKIYLCSGGTSDFMRVFAEELYDILPENVIGSYTTNRFVHVMCAENDTYTERSYIKKEFANFHNTSKLGKPEAIDLRIGRIPIFSAGNVLNGGDIAHLTHSQSSETLNFQLLIHHDDAKREFAYQEKNNASLIAAEKNDWHVVSMKDHWKTIFVNAFD